MITYEGITMANKKTNRSQPNNFDISFINVVMDGDYGYEQEVPLGILSMAAFLRKEDIKVSIEQCFASKKEFEAWQPENNSDLYGIQLNMMNYDAVIKVSEIIKKHNLSAVIVLGGPFISINAKEVLKNAPSIDCIALGEGEYTSLELCKAVADKKQNLNHIKGLVWREPSGKITKNKLRPQVDDLDTLPFPARDFLEDAKCDPRNYGLIDSIRVISSKGCAGRCTFCCVNALSKALKSKRWRGRSPIHVVDELEWLSTRYGARVFNFSDSSFEDPGVIGKKRSADICNQIIERKLKISAKIYMRCETMKSLEDIELLKLYKKAGIDVIIVGVESGSDYELAFYEKHARVADNFRMIKILQNLDCFCVIAGFIMFGPNSTEETLMSNIEFLRENKLAANMLAVSNTMLLVRDSKLYNILNEEGRIIENYSFVTPPKYIFADSIGEKMAKCWDKTIAKEPITRKTNQVFINIENLRARMTNPMNSEILNSFPKEFNLLSEFFFEMQHTLNIKHSDCFLHTLELSKKNASQEELTACHSSHFGNDYSQLYNKMQSFYDSFLKTVTDKGFGLSGLVFDHFLSAESITKDKPRT